MTKPVSNYEYDQLPIGMNFNKDNKSKDEIKSENLNIDNGLKNVNSIIAKKPGNKSFYSNKSNDNKNAIILIKDQSTISKTREEELAELERYEEEQRKLFQDAVQEFRNRNNENNLMNKDQPVSNSLLNSNSNTKINKKVKFNLEKEQSNESEVSSNPDKFLYSVNNHDSKDSNDLFDFGKVLNNEADDYNSFKLGSIEENNAEYIQDVDVKESSSNDKSSVEINKNLLPLYSKKIPCFTCYKFVEIKDSSQEFEYSSSNGTFCSDECERTFIDENIVS